MEKELIHMFEGAQKAADTAVVDGGPEEDRCLDSLNQLKKFPVTYQVLVTTQIGKRLRALTKHRNCRIKVLASEVVETWKDVIVQETAENKIEGEAKDEGSVKVGAVKAVKAESLPHLKSRIDNLSCTKNYKKIRSSGHKKRMKTEIDAVQTEKSPAGVQMKVEKITEENQNIENLEQTEAGRTHVEKKSVYSMFSKKKMKIDADNTEGSLAEVWRKVEMTTEGKQSFVSLETTKEKKAVDAMFKNQKQVSETPPKLDSIVNCEDSTRNKIREMLAQALCKVSGEVDKDLEDVANACDPYRAAVLLETEMFEKWGKSNGAHKLKYRSIIFNLKDQKNPDFRRKVLLGQFEQCSITELTPEQMASETMQQKNEQIKQKALFQCERGQRLEATCEKFKCGRCGKRETTYYQMQTRSADEPMTTYVTCVNCGKRWKFC